MSNIIEFNLINCGNYYYISHKTCWGSPDIRTLKFDGEYAEATNKKEWFKILKIPTTIFQRISGKRTNQRYELLDKYKSVEGLPQVIAKDQEDEYEEILGMYEFKYDSMEDTYEPIEFKINEIYSREDFECIERPYRAETDLLTQIEFPEVAYQDKPCKVTSESLFDIIRHHVKENIDNRYAVIDSDYDFHFQVDRVIQLANPYDMIYNTNALSKRKPKWVTKTIATKKATILNLKRKPSDSNYGKDCHIAPEIVGKDYKDLKNKVDEFLKNLMNEINKKYCECPNCQGWGVVEED